MIMTGGRSTRRKTCHNSSNVPNWVKVKRSLQHHSMNVPMTFCWLLLYHPGYQNKYNTTGKMIFEEKPLYNILANF
jgi:hypothetical protein